MEFPNLQIQSLNNSTRNYFRLPSENSQVQDLYFELNKQILEMINSSELNEGLKIEQLKNIQEVVQNELMSCGYISENIQYNNKVRPFDYNKVCYNEEVISTCAAKVIPLSSNYKYLNSFIAYGDEKRGDLLVNTNGEEVKNLVDSYSDNLVPSISFGVGIGIITAAFRIAMDYVFFPLMILVVADLFLSGCADLFTKQKEGKIFKKIFQYFIIFFILTWLIVLELILLRYNLTPMIKPVICNHLLVYCFLAGAGFMCIKNIKNSMVRLELPVWPFTKVFRFALEKYSPDLIEFLGKYTKENKERDNNKKKDK